MTSTLRPLSIFWDIENIQIPRDVAVSEVVSRIRTNVLNEEYYEDDFIVVCDVHREKTFVVDQLNEAQVTVVHVNSMAKNAADSKLKQCMLKFVYSKRRAEACVVLISSDVNFAPDLANFRFHFRCRVVLLHNHLCSPPLLNCADQTLDFYRLVLQGNNLPGSGRLRCGQSRRLSTILQITNLPVEAAEVNIRRRLLRLSCNTGGRIQYLNPPLAFIRFPSPQNATRAKCRMAYKDVFGRQLRADFVEYPDVEGRLPAESRLHKWRLSPDFHDSIRATSIPQPCSTFHENFEDEHSLPESPSSTPASCNSDGEDNPGTDAWFAGTQVWLSPPVSPGLWLRVYNIPQGHEERRSLMATQLIQLCRHKDGRTIMSKLPSSFYLGVFEDDQLHRDVGQMISGLSQGGVSSFKGVRVTSVKLFEDQTSETVTQRVLEMMSYRRAIRVAYADLEAYLEYHSCPLSAKIPLDPRFLVEVRENDFFGVARVDCMPPLQALKPAQLLARATDPAQVPQTSDPNPGRADPVTPERRTTVTRPTLEAGQVMSLESPNLSVLLSIKELASQVHQVVKDGEVVVDAAVLLALCTCVQDHKAAPPDTFNEGYSGERVLQPMEHLIGCIPGIEVGYDLLGQKVIRKAPQRTSGAASADERRVESKPKQDTEVTLMIKEFSDLLKDSNGRINLDKVEGLYKAKYGKVVSVPKKFTNLRDFFNNAPKNFEILGVGGPDILSLSHRSQMKRFLNDLCRVLRKNNKRLYMSEVPTAFERDLDPKKEFYLSDYGVCFLEDLMMTIPQHWGVVCSHYLEESGEFVVREEARDRKLIEAWLPATVQTACQMRRTSIFKQQVISLICDGAKSEKSIQCFSMAFNKFIPAFHKFFDQQCTVGRYGFTKLADLFDCIGDVVQMDNGDPEKARIILTYDYRRRIIERRLGRILVPGQMVPRDLLLKHYSQKYGTDRALDEVLAAILESSLFLTMQDRVALRETYFPFKHRTRRVLHLRVLRIFMKAFKSLSRVEVIELYRKTFAENLDWDVVEELVQLGAIRSVNTTYDLQDFCLTVRNLMHILIEPHPKRVHDDSVLISSLQQKFQNELGYPLDFGTAYDSMDLFLEDFGIFEVSPTYRGTFVRVKDSVKVGVATSADAVSIAIGPSPRYQGQRRDTREQQPRDTKIVGVWNIKDIEAGEYRTPPPRTGPTRDRMGARFTNYSLKGQK